MYNAEVKSLVMPSSPSKMSVINRIAELAGSRASAESRMEQILDLARETLGLDVLSLATMQASSEETLMWHSFSDGCQVDPDLVLQQAMQLHANPLLENLCHVTPITLFDGYSAAVVAQGVIADKESASVLKIASSYLSVLVENTLLSKAVESSSISAHHHIAEIAAIHEVGQAIGSGEADVVLNMIVEKAAAVMEAQACSLMLRHHRDDALVIEASHGLNDDVIKGARIHFGEGIAGQVAESGRPMLIADVASDPRFKNAVNPRAGISSSMCVPLKDEDGCVCGVLSIRRHVPNPPFNEDDLKLFSVFAMHAALALSSAQLYSRLHRKVAEMSRISEVLRAINSTLDLDHVLNQIVDSITEVVGFDRCCVYLLDSRSNEFVAGARKGYNDEDKIVDRIQINDGVIGIAAKERIPIFSQGSPIEPESQGAIGEFLVAPIVVREESIGVVAVDNSRNNLPIEPEDVEMLATFVSQVGIAVENARLYEAMERKYAELNILYEHSRNISAAYGLDNTADILVKTTSKAVSCDGAGLLLLDPKRGQLTLQAALGGLSKTNEAIAELIQKRESVDYVRDLRTSALISAENYARTRGHNAHLLNAIAPNGASLMLAPLVVEDTTVGVLVIYREDQEFQSAELKLVSIIASHAAMVIRNAIAFEQRMRQKVLELTALYEFSKKISSAANLEEALDSILAIVADLVDYDESFIYGIDQENGTASVQAARFRSGPETIPPDEPLDGGSVISWAIYERKALISPDVSRDPRFSDPSAGQSSIRSLMSIPLIVQDEVVGVLSVHSASPNQYSEDDVRVLSIIASQGAAIYKELEALTALTSYTDNILSSIAAGVATLDSDGVLLTWNNAAERIVGVEVGRVVGMQYREVVEKLAIAKADKDGLTKAIEQVYTSGKTYHGYKLCFHPKHGDDIHMNMNISQLLNSANEQLGLVIIFEDISREIKMEDEFRRMGELAAIGQLAASIAHELRNPLSSIKGAAQFIQKEYENESAIVEFLGIIIEEVNGLNKLTTEFLDFARPMQLEFKPTLLNKVVEKTVQLMGVHITNNNVSIKETLSHNAPEIQADERQLLQVLKNIIINALQAMPEGGSLTIETGPTPSGGAFMSVTDTGIGIAPEKLDRICQPFFTTKTKGTGLGLSVVNKIVENHGGKLEITSEVGQGSTFKVVLPLLGVHTPITTDFDQTMERRVSGELKSGDLT